MAEHNDPNGSFVVDVPGFSREQIMYHVKLLHEAGLIEAMDLPETAQWSGNPQRHDLANWRLSSQRRPSAFRIFRAMMPFNRYLVPTCYGVT